MEEGWRDLSVQLGVKAKCCVSYTQLKRILASIDIESFNAVNEAYFGSTVVRQGPCWKSADGKELRAGRPEPEHRRGGGPDPRAERRQPDRTRHGPQFGDRPLRRLEGVGEARGEDPLRAGRAADGQVHPRRAAHLPAQHGAARPARGCLPDAGQGQPGLAAGGLRADPPASATASSPNGTPPGRATGWRRNWPSSRTPAGPCRGRRTASWCCAA